MTTTGFVETSSYLSGTRQRNTWTCRMHFLGRGSAARVEFNWKKVLQREETSGDVIGFFHTHPQGLTRPSRRDIKTMRAWCDCLGKPLLCIIGIPYADDTEIYGYLFRNFRSRGRKVDLIAHAKKQMIFKE
ncbi:MAG: Mov34/MPN/PAD-1 family protein [Desulfobacterales bacterium]|jgi:hypothetical protein